MEKKMKPLNLILDYTSRAKEIQASIDNGFLGPAETSGEEQETVLMAYYSNGEHTCTFPEVRTPEAGRKAAKTFMKYCPNCVFTDKTKE